MSDWPVAWRWTGPIWTGSVRGTLGAKPNVDNGTLRLASHLYDGEFAQSGFVRNTLALLEKVGGKDVLWIASSGNCPMKKRVTTLRGLISWMELEANKCFRNGKTYREQDVEELHLLRLPVERVGLMRLGGLWFDLTQLSRAILEQEGASERDKSTGFATMS